ncbi:MAG: ArnT family glycosyltransferase [Bacteroidota bacterium]
MGSLNQTTWTLGGWLLAVLAVVAVVAGLRVDLMEVDAAQYASMGQEMNMGSPWMALHEHGALYQSKGYPDKPPLVFWCAALGTRLLGSTAAGAKLFSVLMGLVGIWAIGRWAATLMGPRALWPARLFYGVNLGTGLMLQDVRTDTLLVALVTLAGWQAQVWKQNNRPLHALAAFGFTALGMLAKGPLALMALVAVHGGDALWSNRYTLLRRPAFWWGLLWMILLLLPWLGALWEQWGWHKGVRYYLWTQNFGRISGENPWAQRADPTFVFHNLLWSYAPWSLMLPAALWHALRYRNWNSETVRQALTAWALLALGLSLSRFQLPHYVYILWPFQSLLLVRWWLDEDRRLSWSRPLIGATALLLGGGLLLSDFAMGTFPSAILLVLVLGLLAWLLRSKLPALDGKATLGWASGGMLLLSILLNGLAWPVLMTYQGSSQLGRWANQKGLAPVLWRWDCDDESVHALHFYTRRVVPTLNPDSLQVGQTYLVYSGRSCIRTLQERGFKVKALREIPTHRVTRLTPAFLNPKTRPQVTDVSGIYQIKP